ncbi:HipA family kinase [Roseateles sp. NT4]
MDGDLGPEPAVLKPCLAPVRVLRLNRGAIRVKRRNASRRSDELWVGTGYSEVGSDDDVPLYIRIGAARHIVAELVCSVIGRAIGLPVPEPLIVRIRKGDLPSSRLLDQQAEETLAFASASVGGDSCAQLLREDSEHALRLVMTWRHLLPTTAFDEWMANPDRNLGNIVFAAQNLWLIDHAQALGGKAADVSSLKSLQQKAFPNVLAQLIEVGFPLATRAGHLKQVQRWLNDSTLALDLEDALAATGVRRWHTKRERTQLLEFVRNRLLITHSLLCSRLGHPQLNLQNQGE